MNQLLKKGRTIIRQAIATLIFIGICLIPSAACFAEIGTVNVILETNMGNITLSLFQDEAPVTVANFLSYVDEGFYDGTIFHRVISGFVIQGGGLDAQMNSKQTHDPIVNEASNGLSNDAYTIAMARTTDPNSATSQFFINLADNKGLNYSDTSDGYAVFGEVIEGKDVVDAIGAVSTTTKGVYQNVPANTITIQKAVRINDTALELKTIADQNLAENLPAGTLVATAEVMDADTTGETVSYMLTTNIQDENGNALFAVNGSTGAITLTEAGAAELDFETGPNAYTLGVTANDGTNVSAEETFMVNVTDVKENGGGGGGGCFISTLAVP
ncbi:MAG: peptidylprolyl isomerase [Desulfosalsimonadaceae bacterium]